MNWLYYYRDKPKDHIQYLSDFLTSKNIENNLCAEKVSLQDVFGVVSQKKFSKDPIRFDFVFSDVLISSFETNKAVIESLYSADCLVREKNSYWLDCACFYGIQKSILNLKMQIDNTKSALLIGSTSYSRLICIVLIKLGFKRINISSMFEEQGKDLIKSLRKVYFGVDFEFISQDQLIKLPGKHSLLVNTLGVNEVTELLHNELYYFNFLNPGGIVWDLSNELSKSILLDEAEKVGIKFFSSMDSIVETDLLWVKWAFDIQLDSSEYREFLSSKI